MAGREILVAAVPIGQFVFYNGDRTAVKGLEATVLRDIAKYLGANIRYIIRYIRY